MNQISQIKEILIKADAGLALKAKAVEKKTMLPDTVPVVLDNLAAALSEEGKTLVYSTLDPTHSSKNFIGWRVSINGHSFNMRVREIGELIDKNPRAEIIDLVGELVIRNLNFSVKNIRP